MRRVLIILLLLIMLSLCLKSIKEERHLTSNLSMSPKISMIYFYNPNCPFCKAIDPYIDYLSTLFDVEYCNVLNITNCSREAILYMAIIINKTGSFAVPTLIVKGNESVVFQGFDNIAFQLEKYLEKEYNYSIEIFVGNKYYKPSECYSCHIQRKIEPPRSFSCTSCCHIR